MSRLTDLGIRRAKAKSSVYSLCDGRGLSLRIEPSGAKLWHFRFYWQGKQQRISFGSFPEVDLCLARERRESARELLARGIDPRLVEAVGEASGSSVVCITFGEFAERWKALKLLKLGTELKQRQSTRVQIERYLRKDLLPHLGHLPLDRISQREVLGVLRQIEARGALSIAEKCRGWLNELFRHAMAEGLIGVNPVNDVDVVLLPCRPPRHNPFLRMGDLPELLGLLSGYQGDRRIVLGIRLLLLTAVRPGELRYAEPCHFDLDKGLWNIPAEQVKQLQRLALSLPKGSVPPFVVPLPKQAIRIIKELLSLRYQGQRYLLPHRSEPLLCISENTLNQCLRRIGYKDRLTTHGIRATISTALNELGYPKEWIEAQLSHSDKDQVRAAYNHALYVEQRREMMQAWADKLDGWQQEGVSLSEHRQAI
ncbi:tyrosine-type recombinase/integrase [Orbus mooreae]|uniref:tyrosine-type recombinase/integrase n=1 Tax=Orbus mooreae TaxID=3074107 RepID=UPI00370DC123